jgi:hypothetical protein
MTLTASTTTPENQGRSTMSKTMFVVVAVACATPALADVSGYGFGAPEPGPGDGLRARVDQLLGCAAFQPGDVSQQEWDECFGDIPYMCGDEPVPGCLQVTAARFDGGRESTGPTRGIHHERTAPSRRDQDRRPSSELGELQLAGGGQGSNHEGTNSDTGGGSSAATSAGGVAGGAIGRACCGTAGAMVGAAIGAGLANQATKGGGKVSDPNLDTSDSSSNASGGLGIGTGSAPSSPSTGPGGLNAGPV